MKAYAKSIIKAFLPSLYNTYHQHREQVNYRRRSLKKINEERQSHRQDIKRFPLGNSAFFECYWKIYGIGRGPALALYINEEEVLKFDFYGRGKGHYHVQVSQPHNCRSHALFMVEQSIPEQIERAIFEIENNLDWYLERYPTQAIRSFRPQKYQLKSLSPEIRSTLLGYINQVPSEPIQEPSAIIP